MLQLAFFNLAENEYINLYLSPLLNWRMTNGINLIPKHSSALPNKNQRLLLSNRSLYIDGMSIVTKSSEVLPMKIKILGYSHSFVENVNIMLVILVVEFVVAISLYFISSKITCLNNIASILLK